MKPEFEARWKEEIWKLNNRLRKPAELLTRGVSNDDFIDSAVIGGVTVADVLAGRIDDHQIAPDVIRAFHDQYPNIRGGFVDAVQRLHEDPGALAGLVNGVKGKLFEENYVGWLNDGNLPEGFHAELATHANNPAWDIAVKDSRGHIAQLLQAKATESMQYVQHAFEAHPGIDVVTTHEVFQNLSDHGANIDHLIDSHQTLSGVTDHVADAADSADAATSFAFHVPWLAVSWAVFQNYGRYREGRLSFEEFILHTGQRAGLAFAAVGAAWAAANVVAPYAAIPAAIITRLYGMRFLGNMELRTQVEKSITWVHASREHLELQIPREVDFLSA